MDKKVFLIDKEVYNESEVMRFTEDVLEDHHRDRFVSNSWVGEKRSIHLTIINTKYLVVSDNCRIFAV